MCQNERDRLLNELALAAQSHPPGSLERQKILDRLFRELSKAIRRISPRIETEFDRYLYDEAKQVTLQEMFRRIDEYKPQRGDVLGWYNYLFSCRLVDAQRKYYQRGLTRIPTNKTTLKLADLDTVFSDENFRSNDLSPSQELKKLIEEDPNQMFSSLHVTGRPDANFRFLILAKVWEGHIWKNISKELGISVPTLSGFYQTHLETFIPFFRNYLNQ
jgi:hypothetical protein